MRMFSILSIFFSTCYCRNNRKNNMFFPLDWPIIFEKWQSQGTFYNMRMFSVFTLFLHAPFFHSNFYTFFFITVFTLFFHAPFLHSSLYTHYRKTIVFEKKNKVFHPHLIGRLNFANLTNNG